MNKRMTTLPLTATLTVILAWAMATPIMASSDDHSTVDLQGMHTRGSGDVVAVEYSDLECIYCKRLYHTMIKVMDHYEDKLVWGYKHFPLTSIHPKAKRESMASECAAEQEQLFPFIKHLFHTTTFSNNLTDHRLVHLANDVGVEPKQFRQCLKSRKYLTRINNDIAEGNRLDIIGTPTLLIVDDTGHILDRIEGAQPENDILTVLDQYID